MKATDFTKVLREIVRKEVRTVIREELNEALAKIKAPQPSRTPTSAREMFLSNPKPKPAQPLQRLTGNASLDSILAETANDLRNGRSTPIQDSGNGGWDTMGHFGAEDAQTFGMMQEDAYDGDFGSYDPTAAFMKDYSGVLENSYKHSGIK